MSGHVSYAGYVESRGGIGLPDIPQLGDVVSLFGDTNDMRVWWRSSTVWRVDKLATAGETDTYSDKAGYWQWDSAHREATRTNGIVPVRLPRAADLLPPQLAYRVLGEVRTGERLFRLPARRIAGRDALGLGIRPASSESTISKVECWVDRSTGLPLAVDIVGRGASTPALTTQFLDLAVRQVSAHETTFSAPPDATVQTVAALDVTAELSRLTQYAWPMSLGGLPRRDQIAGLTGVATYGEGFAAVTVIPLTFSLADDISSHLTGPPAVRANVPGADAIGVVTPLVNGLLITTSDGAYLLAGTVTLTALEQMAEVLVTTPPPEVGP
jgi:hypothetical protein